MQIIDKIEYYKNEIEKIEGTLTRDMHDENVKTGLLLLYDKLACAQSKENNDIEIAEINSLIRLEIIKKNSYVICIRINTSQLEAKEQNLLAARKLNADLISKSQILQKALIAHGLTDSIYNINNINTSSLSHTILLSRSESTATYIRNAYVVHEPYFEERNKLNIGYLHKLVDLDEHIKSLGISSIQKSDTGSNMKDGNGNICSIDNHTIKCIAHKDDEASLIKMVGLFEKLVYFRFLANDSIRY